MSVHQEQIRELKALVKSRAFSLYRANTEDNLGGKYVQELESLFCEYHNCKHAIAVSSATTGLHIANIALKSSGKSIITTPVTFSATASSILMADGIPIFVDIQPDIYNLDPQQVKEHRDNAQVVGILPVHLHGHPCDIERLMFIANHYGWYIIEDCAQAIGAIWHGQKVGTFGNCGVFSFNQSKQINSGEGGMIITNDDNLAYTLRLLRNHGETQAGILGYNYRLTEIQAAILIPQFKVIEQTIEQTTQLCEQVSHILSDVELLQTPVVYPNCRHVYYTYPIAVKGYFRNRLQHVLKDRGIYFGNGGYKPLYLIPFYRQYSDDLLVSNWQYEQVMFTNIFRPPMKLSEARRIAKEIKETVWQINH